MASGLDGFPIQPYRFFERLDRSLGFTLVFEEKAEIEICLGIFRFQFYSSQEQPLRFFAAVITDVRGQIDKRAYIFRVESQGLSVFRCSKMFSRVTSVQRYSEIVVGACGFWPQGDGLLEGLNRFTPLLQLSQGNTQFDQDLRIGRFELPGSP
jgi:hypothetical protein